jgi:transposase
MTPLSLDREIGQVVEKEVTVMDRRQFTKEFKLEVVQQVEAGLSMAEASRRYEVHSNLVRKWRQLFEKYGENAFRGHGRLYTEEAKIAALERKIGQLTMENESLRKLIALDKQLAKTNGRSGN